MRCHLPALDHGRMDPAPARYMIRINGHLGATMLSAFPALAPQHHGAHTVLTGLLDQSALYGVLADIEALGLDLLEIQKPPNATSGRAPTWPVRSAGPTWKSAAWRSSGSHRWSSTRSPRPSGAAARRSPSPSGTAGEWNR